MRHYRLMGLFMVATAAMLLAGCGGGGELHGATRLAASPTADAEPDQAGVTLANKGFSLTIAPETFAGAKPVELRLDLSEDECGVTATITAPTSAKLTALCARLDYDAQAYTAQDVEWLAGFAQDGSCLTIEQLAIPGTAYLGCVPVAQPRLENGGLCATVGGQGCPPHPECGCAVPLARVRFTRGGGAGKGVSAETASTEIIQDERLNLLDKALHWKYSFQGDYDNNGEVSFADLLLIASHYLETPTQETGDHDYNYLYFRKDLIQYRLDYIQDGEINQGDMLGLEANFGKAITEWRVYASLNPADYHSTPLAAPSIAALMTMPFSNIERTAASGNNYVASLPMLAEGTGVWVYPVVDGAVAAPSALLQYNTEGLSSIRLEYDEEMMQYYGGLPEKSELTLWAAPSADLLLQLDASAGPDLYQGSIFYDDALFAPDPNLANSGQFILENSTFWFALSADKQRIQFSTPRIFARDGSFSWTLRLLREPEQRLPHQYSQTVLRCGPDSRFDADPTWDAASRTFSWLYCGYGDATQDGCCSAADDVVLIPLRFAIQNPAIESIAYLADYDHNTEVNAPDLQVFTLYLDRAHDGYNMYYGAPNTDAVQLTYAGHVALSEGVGNRYIERLRFSFQYPPEVGPGTALYYRPTLGEQEGELAWLYTVPEE
jgi:hypothetical protein